MRDKFEVQKRIILAVVGIFIVADLALGAYMYQQSVSPHTPQQTLAMQYRQMELQRADLKRAKNIRQRIPAIQKGFDQFEASLLPASKGYSTLTAELYAIGGKAGVKVDDVNFHQKDIPSRGLSEVAIEATVTGEYAGVVRFLNGLQRSQNVYAVQSLSLAQASNPQNPSAVVRVNLHMKTYFRAAP